MRPLVKKGSCLLELNQGRLAESKRKGGLLLAEGVGILGNDCFGKKASREGGGVGGGGGSLKENFSIFRISDCGNGRDYRPGAFASRERVK